MVRKFKKMREPGRRWSREEDALVNRLGIQAEDLLINELAAYWQAAAVVMGRTPNACRVRYSRLRKEQGLVKERAPKRVPEKKTSYGIRVQQQVGVGDQTGSHQYGTQDNTLGDGETGFVGYSELLRQQG